MMLKLKLRDVGNSIGMVLPRAALARLNVTRGDALYITESPEGGFRLTAANPEFGRQMEAAESVVRRYRNTLTRLAK